MRDQPAEVPGGDCTPLGGVGMPACPQGIRCDVPEHILPTGSPGGWALVDDAVKLLPGARRPVKASRRCDVTP
eukprot:7414482-Alexandrium_andersonii.AAC.1